MTANPVRGEADLGGQKIVVNFNNFCSLEAAMGKTVPEILGLMDKGMGFSDLRTCVAVFSENGLSDVEAGNLIEEVTYAEALKALSVAVGGFFSPKKKDKADRPLKAA